MAKSPVRGPGHVGKPVLRRHGRRRRTDARLRDRRRGDGRAGHRPANRRARRRRRSAVAAGRHLQRHRRRELTMRVAAIVLAAGEASRFGSPKQRILLPHVLERLRETSGGRDRRRRGRVRARAPERRAGSSRCPEWARGPGASLRCGLAALGTDVEAAVVVLADGPESLAAGGRARARRRGARAAESSRRHTTARAAIRSFSDATDWDDVPDEGLRDRPVRLVPCDDLGAPGDVDVEDPERSSGRTASVH